MIILDTNVISELFRAQPNPKVVSWVVSLSGEVAITAITVAELLAGVHRLPGGRRKDLLAKDIETALKPYRNSQSLLLFDSEAARYYADVVVHREKAGQPISTADAQIAAICLAHNATCATRNVKDFAHTGVQLFNPWDPPGSSD